MKRPETLVISVVTLAAALGASVLPLIFPVTGLRDMPLGAWLATAVVLSLLVLVSQRWRVAIRGTRGDVSISMAVDVATMLLLHPYLAATGSAVGTALYHAFRFTGTEHRVRRALVRGIVTFFAVVLGGWWFHFIRPAPGPIVFTHDWLEIGMAIALRLGIRVIFYPLGMAALRSEPVMEQLRHEWNRLPVVPFALTTTLGGLAALVWQSQPAATILLFGPLAATWAATNEFSRLNELLATLEVKVADRTAQLGESVRELQRRIGEFEALGAVGEAMVRAIQPDEVLGVIARETMRVTGGTSALVILLSEDGKRQFVRAAHGEGMAAFLGTELPLETSLAGLVARTGSVAVSTDPAHDPRLNQAIVQSGNWQSVIEAPLRAKDRVLGVLVAATARSGGFDEQHIRLLTLFANQAGLYLENARLHEKGLELAVLEERNRIARELHDSVTQVLFSLTLNLDAAEGLMEKKPERARALVTRSQEMASAALAEMRSLIFELRPAALQEKGLAMALANHINLYRRRQGVDVTLELAGEERLPPEMEFCLYRVAQEALNNIAKHAQAKHVSVSLHATDGVATLVVTDDGVGFDRNTVSGGPSFGMIGMQERLTGVGGTLTVSSSPGRGTRIEARIPLAQ